MGAVDDVLVIHMISAIPVEPFTNNICHQRTVGCFMMGYPLMEITINKF
jgi:hypothetical protein